MSDLGNGWQEDPRTGLLGRPVGILQEQPVIYMPDQSPRVQVPQSWEEQSYIPVQRKVSIVQGVLLAGAGLIGTIFFGKVVQAATDTVFDHRLFPRTVRRELIAKHIACHGPYCPSCGEYTLDWEIDHRHPWSRGGLTSLANAQVLCRGCNNRKSDSFSFLDVLLGRADVRSFFRALFSFL